MGAAGNLRDLYMNVGYNRGINFQPVNLSTDTGIPRATHSAPQILTNCMLPVMIVQVIQIVYFYFGVFD